MSKAKKFKDLVKKKAQPDAGQEDTRKEWVSDIVDLFEKIGAWLVEEEIEHRLQPVELTDARLGKYNSAMMVIMHGDYEATIRPEYDSPIGKGRCVRIKSGKKSGGNLKILTRDKTGEKAQWKVPINTLSKVGRNLNKDRFFELLISIFGLEEE